jgi:hypothetical protein
MPPRVLDGDRDDRRAVSGRPDDEFRSPVRLAWLPDRSSPDSHHLLELYPVAAHPRKLLGDSPSPRLDHSVALHQPNDFADDLVQVERHALEVALLNARAASGSRLRSLVVLDESPRSG